MPENPTNILPCWINSRGEVEKYGPAPDDTPATAIPDEVLAEVVDHLRAIKESGKSHYDRDRARLALSLLGDTP